MNIARLRYQLSPRQEQERRELVGVLKKELGEVLLDDSDEGFLSTNQVALIFRVSPATIRRWSDTGKLRARRSFGGHRMFQLSVIRRALTQMGKPDVN